MIYQVFLLVVAWIIFTIIDMCLIGILDGKKMDFENLISNDLIVLIMICIFAPVVFVILLLGVAAKGGICISNNITISGEKNCSRCVHCLNNECMFFNLAIKPKMLCRGRFYSDN
jgi:hypothetical protein